MKKLVGVMLKKMFLREMGSQRKIVRGRGPSGLVSWASPSLAALSVFDVRSSKRTSQVRSSHARQRMSSRDRVALETMDGSDIYSRS